MDKPKYWDANVNDWVECKDHAEEKLRREKGYRFYGEYPKADAANDERAKKSTLPPANDLTPPGKPPGK